MMHQCQTCSFVAKNKAGLSAHTRAHKMRGDMEEPQLPEVPAPQVTATDLDCPNCSLLPAGSVNITSMFVVVVFCLTAVLFTAMYKLNVQTVEINALQEELAGYASDATN